MHFIENLRKFGVILNFNAAKCLFGSWRDENKLIYVCSSSSCWKQELLFQVVFTIAIYSRKFIWWKQNFTVVCKTEFVL